MLAKLLSQMQYSQLQPEVRSSGASSSALSLSCQRCRLCPPLLLGLLLLLLLLWLLLVLLLVLLLLLLLALLLLLFLLALLLPAAALALSFAAVAAEADLVPAVFPLGSLHNNLHKAAHGRMASSSMCSTKTQGRMFARGGSAPTRWHCPQLVAFPTPRHTMAPLDSLTPGTTHLLAVLAQLPTLPHTLVQHAVAVAKDKAGTRCNREACCRGRGGVWLLLLALAPRHRYSSSRSDSKPEERQALEGRRARKVNSGRAHLQSLLAGQRNRGSCRGVGGWRKLQMQGP